MRKFKYGKVLLASFLLLGTVSLSPINSKAQTTSDDKLLEKTIEPLVNQLEESSTTKDLVEVLKEAEDSKDVENLTNSQKEELLDTVLSSVSEETLTEYQEDKLEEVKNIINSYEVVVGDGGEQVEEEFTLEDNSTLTLSANDEADINESSGIMTLASYEQSPNVSTTKDYGNRRFTCSVYVKSLGLTIATLKLKNHYKINSSGLTMRKTSILGTNGTKLSDVSEATSKTTDKYAEKVGYNINAEGSYKLTGSLNNGYVGITSTIKLVKLNKTKKNAYVKQSFVFNT